MMEPIAFLEKLAEQLACDLTANGAIRGFTTNPKLIGAYAEATVRHFVARMVSPLRVSHGSIIWEGNCPDAVPEIDTIIWAPCPAPAVFEAGEFALIPRGSAFAFLEIKRSNYTGASRAIAESLKRADELLPLVDGEGMGFNVRKSNGDIVPTHAIGVVCIRERAERRLAALEEQGLAIVLLERKKTGEIIPNPAAMFALVNFLVGIRARAKLLDGRSVVNWRNLSQGLESHWNAGISPRKSSPRK